MDHPILFSAPMICAILEGRKTQTRRVMTPSNTLMNGDTWSRYDRAQTWDWGGAWVDPGPSPAGNPGPYLKLPFLAGDDATLAGCVMRVYPKIQPGDRLWVKEAWKVGPAYDDLPPRDLAGEECLLYLADNAEQKWGWDHPQKYGRYRHSRFMPRWASRLTLTVTDVRVQRLQDISEGGAISEGGRPFFDYDNPNHIPCPNGSTMEMAPLKGPIDAFQNIWNSINGPDAWDANPWVVALTFTPHPTNIDQMEKDQ